MSNKCDKISLVDDAQPAKYFNVPPFRAEQFTKNTAGVMNKNNINCLTFKSSTGTTLTDFNTASKIADLWNTLK